MSAVEHWRWWRVARVRGVHHALALAAWLVIGCAEPSPDQPQPVEQAGESATAATGTAGANGFELAAGSGGGVAVASVAGVAGVAAIRGGADAPAVAGGAGNTAPATAAGRGAVGGIGANAGSGGAASGTGARAGTGGAAGTAVIAGTGAALASLTLWIAGDSTVMTYGASDAPQEGWGQELHMFMDPKVTINNQALGGRSSRTFMYGNVTCEAGQVTYTGGKPSQSGTRWERISNTIKAGDYCLIQFGHNDAGTVCERRVEIPEFKQNLTTMATEIRARNATPIFVTPMSQLSYTNGTFKATLTNYATAMKEAAAAADVTIVDLNSSSIEFYRSAGYAEVSTSIFLPGETTHFQKQGAFELARLVSEGLAASKSGLATYVKR